jgi:two-component system phosphate regulon response regulator PhoB
MAEAQILVVEDEPPIRELIRVALEKADYAVMEAGDAQEADIGIAACLPDLVLLDWMLPGVSGIEYSRRLKTDELTRDIPVILLTARVEEEDKVRGLEAGADDYVTKPFSPRELVARIRAVLRRTAPQAEEGIIKVDDLVVDTASHRVLVDGATVHLGPIEFRLLRFFATHPERVYSREQILDRVWSRNTFIEERTVDVHILRLRKALEDTGYHRYVQTVRGIGYRFSANA